MNPFLFWGILVAAVMVEIWLCWKSRSHIWMLVGFALATTVYALKSDSFNVELALWLFAGIVCAQFAAEIVTRLISFVKKQILSRKNT